MQRIHEISLFVGLLLLATPLGLSQVASPWGQGFLSTIAYLSSMLGFLLMIPAAIAMLIALVAGIATVRNLRGQGSIPRRTLTTYFLASAFWAVVLATPAALIAGLEEIPPRIAAGFLILGILWIPVFALRRS